MLSPFKRFSIVTKTKDFSKVVEKIPEILKKHKFGVLFTLNAKQVLKEKINYDTHDRIIFGVCNPHLAAKMFEIDTNFGGFAPCHLQVEQATSDSEVSIIMVDGEVAMAPFLKSGILPYLKEANEGFEKVFSELKNIE